MSYEVRGTLLEVCTCDVHCACCWSGDEPSGDACDRVIAWQIEHGSVDGLDLSNVTVAMVGQLDGDGAAVRSMIFLPDHISNEQADAITQLWSGAKGGPMADLARMLGTIEYVERTTITHHEGGHLVIGSRVTAEVPAAADGDVVSAQEYSADVPEFGMSFSVSGQRAVHGAFHFVG